jgi:hypothetical protein
MAAALLYFMARDNIKVKPLETTLQLLQMVLDSLLSRILVQLFVKYALPYCQFFIFQTTNPERAYGYFVLRAVCSAICSVNLAFFCQAEHMN